MHAGRSHFIRLHYARMHIVDRLYIVDHSVYIINTSVCIVDQHSLYIINTSVYIAELVCVL